MGAGGLLGALLSARLSRLLPPGQTVLAAGWWLALALPAVTLPFGPLWPGLVLAAVMLVMPAVNVTMQSTLLTQIPDGMQGRIGALLMVTSLGTAPLGPLLSGFLTEALGPTVALGILGTLIAAFSTVATVTPSLRVPARVGSPIHDS